LNDVAPHLLVIDDDTRLRQLLSRYLSQNGFRVTAAKDAAEARDKLAAIEFDLLIADVMMPGQSGTEFVAELRRTSPVPVLMLTALGEPADRIKGLESGVDDYLIKPFEPRELVLRVNAILRRASAPALGSRAIKFGDFQFDPAKGELMRGATPIYLTSTEIALLTVFARQPGVTVGRGELVKRTGGGEGRAIDVQIARLRRKIEADPKAPRYLQTVWGEGYVLWVD
jgi:two-component system phosphate regulon response regulator OmpR